MAKLDRSTTPSAFDQFGVWFENTEHFVAIGNLLPIKFASPSHLGDLSHHA